MPVTSDDARGLVCAHRPDAGGIIDRRLRAVARLPCHSARRVRHASRTALDRQRPERLSAVVSDHERLVEVHSQVAIRPYSCRLAGLRHAGHPQPDFERESRRGSGRIRGSRRLRCSRSTRGADRACERRRRQRTAARRRRHLSKARRCRSHDAVACARRWLCRGSGGGSSTTISLAGRRHPSSWGPLSIDSSMSSNGHWSGTTSGSDP